jgi:transaldolase
MINLKTEIYADGAEIKDILSLNKKKFIKGFTTNPSLMRKSGVKDYVVFCQKILRAIKKKPVSFEVFSDNTEKIKDQARKISSWGRNVFVKIPIQNTKGKDMTNLIIDLSFEKIKINVTAVFTFSQVKKIIDNVNNDSEVIISVFAGRIADTGIDPEVIVAKIVKYSQFKKNIKILWASPREIFNLYQAHRCGCHLITLSGELIKKLKFYNKNLESFSRETSLMFFNDARSAGYKL